MLPRTRDEKEKVEFKGSLLRVFKQQFSIFLKIRVCEKVYEETRNVV